MSFLDVRTYPPCGRSNNTKFLRKTNSKQEIFPVAVLGTILQADLLPKKSFFPNHANIYTMASLTFRKQALSAFGLTSFSFNRDLFWLLLLVGQPEGYWQYSVQACKAAVLPQSIIKGNP